MNFVNRRKYLIIFCCTALFLLAGCQLSENAGRKEKGTAETIETVSEVAIDPTTAESIIVTERKEQTESVADTVAEPPAVPAAETAGETTEEPTVWTEPVTEYIPKIKNTSEYVIAIDAGHQARGNFEKEPIGPGAEETKNKVAGGTSGVSSGMPEYELTLAVALKLKALLLERGYQVLMIRETNDVDISNAERAIMANNAGADVFLRIHADASEAGSANGMTALCQTVENPYNGSVYSYSRKLSECVLDAMAAETGARNRGIIETDAMSGINWSQVPVTIIEMGFMTNVQEDQRMSTEDYQSKLALGMAQGIENYLAGLGQ